MRRLALMIALCLTLAAPTAAQDSTPHHKSASKKESIVYITRKGNKYHTDSCRFLNKSKIPLALSEAKRYYKPCKICKPPE